MIIAVLCLDFNRGTKFYCVPLDRKIPFPDRTILTSVRGRGIIPVFRRSELMIADIQPVGVVLKRVKFLSDIG